MIKNDTSGATLASTYDAAGLPIDAGDAVSGEHVDFPHDAVGNLTGVDSSVAANDWTYTYDALFPDDMRRAGHLLRLGGHPGPVRPRRARPGEDPTKGSTTTTFTYRGMGEQIAKTTGSTTTTYVSIPGGEPLAEKTGSTASFYLRDPHGDVVGLASTVAGNQGTSAFDPYGKVLATTGASSFLGYQGDMTDSDTKQVDMGDPVVRGGAGRFTSRDVLELTLSRSFPDESHSACFEWQRTERCSTRRTLVFCEQL